MKADNNFKVIVDTALVGYIDASVTSMMIPMVMQYMMKQWTTEEDC